jgi:hypothetical protein
MQAKAPTNTAPPTISGTPEQGQTLDASKGSWTGTKPIHYAFQWQRDGANISGAAGSSYAITPSDAGQQLGVVVTATNEAGGDSASSSPTSVLTSPSAEASLSTGTAQVGSAPTGPPTPSGGWYVAFADAFGAPLGTGAGQDNTWYPNRFPEKPAEEAQPGSNSDELQVYKGGQVRVGPEGLELVVKYQPNAGTSYGTTKSYLGGEITTGYHTAAPAGYQLFNWQPGQGETWAFEVVCKWPKNTGEMDNAFWSSDYRWTDEFDYFEAWGWNTTEWGANYNAGVVWLAKGGGGGRVGYEHQFGKEFDPSAAFHRYTTVIYPDNTFSEYVDGRLELWVGSSGTSAKAEPNTPWMGLIVQNALRKYSTNFSSGERSFDIRSVAVYEDGNHAGQAISGGGTAPGTVVQ